MASELVSTVVESWPEEDRRTFHAAAETVIAEILKRGKEETCCEGCRRINPHIAKTCSEHPDYATRCPTLNPEKYGGIKR